MSDVAHPTTKKAGGENKTKKKQSIKPQRAETKPAPHGQRITPVIDPALVKKVNEEIQKRARVSASFFLSSDASFARCLGGKDRHRQEKYH